MTAPTPASLPPRLVLFDGVCGLCERSVQWILAHDPEGLFVFAPLQGPTAEAARGRHATIPRDLDTIVLLEQTDGGERVTLRSRAIFRILATLPELPLGLRLLRTFSILPAFLTDLGYRVVAAIRYRVFGEHEVCRIPTPSERARFLD